MLIQFSVKNFMSFKEKQEFSMIAGIGNENIDNVVLSKEKILKTSAVYGANASGKTNLIRAFTSAIMMLRLSNTRQPEEKLSEMIPFGFDEKTKNAPCEFEFIFTVNENKYVYGFKADKYKVHEEYLYRYFTAKPTRIFERTECNNYKFLQSDETKLNNIKDQNLDNKLFLATATTWNYDKTKEAYLWLSKMIDTYYFSTDRINIFSLEAYDNDKNGQLKKFTLKLLEQADIVIKDYNVEIKEMDFNSDMISQMNNLKVSQPQLKQKIVKSITMSHEVKDENNLSKVYNLDISNESSGTKILFSFAPILKDAFEKGKVVIIDEIEKSLHPTLVEVLVKLFHDKDINIGNAQLIFNTHDTNLLSLDLFRRDQIWFTEKDARSGSTEIYPLDDFSVRKNENIQKGYLSGRYGAIPFITGDSLWQV